MNMPFTPTFVEQLRGCKFEDLVISTEIKPHLLDDLDHVGFTLVPKNPLIKDVFLEASMPVSHAKKTIVWNTSGDPQEDQEPLIDGYSVDTNTACLVVDFDGVMAIENMPFLLTQDQADVINEYLDEVAEYFFEKSINSYEDYGY